MSSFFFNFLFLLCQALSVNREKKFAPVSQAGAGLRLAVKLAAYGKLLLAFVPNADV